MPNVIGQEATLQIERVETVSNRFEISLIFAIAVASSVMFNWQFVGKQVNKVLSLDTTVIIG